MPELPEVETIRRETQRLLPGLTITAAHATTPSRWDTTNDCIGMTVTEVDRKGKYLLLNLHSPAGAHVLVIHLGMTGRLSAGTEHQPDKRHLRALLELKTSPADSQPVHVTLHDPRGFGFARLARPDDLTLPPWSTSTFGRLGPDPIDPQLDTQATAANLTARTATTSVKAALLDQQSLAGVGNYMADEACWHARISPYARKLSPAKAQAVVRAVVRVAFESCEHGGVSVRDYVHADGTKGTYGAILRAYGRSGLPCMRCANILIKSRLAGRGTTWCPSCQPDA